MFLKNYKLLHKIEFLFLVSVNQYNVNKSGSPAPVHCIFYIFIQVYNIESRLFQLQRKITKLFFSFFVKFKECFFSSI